MQKKWENRWRYILKKTESSAHVEGVALVRIRGSLSLIRGTQEGVTTDFSRWVNVGANLWKIYSKVIF